MPTEISGGACGATVCGTYGAPEAGGKRTAHACSGPPRATLRLRRVRHAGGRYGTAAARHTCPRRAAPR
eukprot:scaffold43407_cov50-Phaeocystis_antarctica.AAC.2